MQVEPQQRDAHPTEDHSGSMNLPTSVAERINETYALVVRHHIYQADALQIATCRISGSSVLLSADKKLLVAAKTEGLEALDIETDEEQITNRFR